MSKAILFSVCVIQFGVIGWQNLGSESECAYSDGAIKECETVALDQLRDAMNCNYELNDVNYKLEEYKRALNACAIDNSMLLFEIQNVKAKTYNK